MGQGNFFGDMLNFVDPVIGGIRQGEAQRKAQEKSLRQQQAAQDQATNAAASAKREADMEQRKANQATPDMASLLSAAMKKKAGVQQTMLTGSGGVDTSSLTLGRTSLLGS